MLILLPVLSRSLRKPDVPAEDLPETTEEATESTLPPNMLPIG